MSAIPGVVFDMPREKYDRLARINWSKLKHLARSPAHFRHAELTPDEDTDPKKLGRAGHCAVFEPALFLSLYVRWDGGRRAGKEWEAFKAEHEEQEILTEREWELCMAIQKAVRADPQAAPYLSGGRAATLSSCDGGAHGASSRPSLATWKEE